MATNNAIDSIKDKLDTIPLINVAVFDIISLLNNPDSNFEQITERLSPDLAARFLKMANSVYPELKIRSLSLAVRMLGYSEMKHILVTSAVIDQFSQQLKDFSFEKFQKQAQFCAAISKILGDVVDYQKPQDLFTVAILHNIGKLVIAVHFNDEHKKIIALKKAEGIPTDEAEQQILGISHNEIGALVLEKSNVPQDICDAVRFHHATDRIIPEGSNYQLELISRESAKITGRFALPVKIDPLEIMNLLRGTIEKSREIYKERMKTKDPSKGHKEVFTELLEQISDLIYRGLKGFKERIRLN